MFNYTRNECERCEFSALQKTLAETLSDAVVVQIPEEIQTLADAMYVIGTQNHTRNEWRRCKPTLETGGEDVTLHSKQGEKM